MVEGVKITLCLGKCDFRPARYISLHCPGNCHEVSVLRKRRSQLQHADHNNKGTIIVAHIISETHHGPLALQQQRNPNETNKSIHIRTMKIVLHFLLLAASIQSSVAFLPAAARHHMTPTRAWCARGSSDAVAIALTREEGKNDKLAKALHGRPEFEPMELPCIAHADGDDYPRLREMLLSQTWDFVAVTSPEGAKVLASVCEGVTSVPPLVAVGKATEEVLEEHGLSVSFCPSKATAKTLIAELPCQSGQSILYPASQRAPGTLEDGLRQRGVEVVRLNTYDTVTASWSDSDRLQAEKCEIACFASPSAIKGWLHNSSQKTKVLAACIGETSARCCVEMGWDQEHIFYPEKPGIEGWVEAIDQAMSTLSVKTS